MSAITARLTAGRSGSDVASPTLELSGTGARPRRIEAIGARCRIGARITGRGKTWRAVLTLRASRWGVASLPLPSGVYEIVVIGADDARIELDAVVPVTQLGVIRAEVSRDRLIIGPPINPAYDSGEGQDALERRYATRTQGLENAVFFESFYGRNASCNPLAIDRELARVAPNVVRYWSVVDLSVAVPEGAIAVVEGSPEWWRARGAARLLVVNDWLRRRFSRRTGQVVLQTWHGTPLKRLALDRSGFAPRRVVAVLRESRRWNVLLAQSPYAARILRKAYAFARRPVWVEGYPRNDILVDDSARMAENARTVRDALGLGEGERVVLYAPTWRDDRDQIVDFLDLPRLAQSVRGAVLVRGHSRTILPGADVETGEGSGHRVIDVTTYPDVAQLLTVADVLITDYSSVMFDFSATGKPMYFFAPDLDHYRGELRGFYFDLEAHAPGPVTSTQDELERALADEGVGERYADRYSAWRAQFNSRDDGRAAERVVARILDQGFVSRLAD
jgi:CDP-glycerol glycerophosphotransferase